MLERILIYLLRRVRARKAAPHGRGVSYMVKPGEDDN
jgi:hypothetical protein